MAMKTYAPPSLDVKFSYDFICPCFHVWYHQIPCKYCLQSWYEWFHIRL